MRSSVLANESQLPDGGVHERNSLFLHRFFGWKMFAIGPQYFSGAVL